MVEVVYVGLIIQPREMGHFLEVTRISHLLDFKPPVNLTESLLLAVP
jgi:hypothetical protein